MACCGHQGRPSTRVHPNAPNPAPLVCPSCGTSGAGPFCAACGERFLRREDLDFRHFFFKQLPHEWLDIDGKLPRTLRRLLLQPGQLAADYVAGCRQRYVSPLRMYLLGFVLHAFLFAAFGNPAETLAQRVQRYDSTGLMSRLLRSRPDINWNDPQLSARLAGSRHWLSEGGTLLIYLLVAAILQLVLYRQHRRYLEHVQLTLTVGAFYPPLADAIALITLVAARQHLEDVDGAAQEIIALTISPLYWFLAIRRSYGLSNAWAALAALTLAAGQSVVVLGLNIAVLAIGIASV